MNESSATPRPNTESRTNDDRTDDEKYFPAVDCKPWCEHQDGHPRQFHRDDQWCGSPREQIQLLHLQGQIGRDGDHTENHLATYVMQRPGSEPEVHLGLGDSNGWVLTIEESVSLALTLLLQAEVVRRGKPFMASTRTPL